MKDKRTYINKKEHGEDMSHENESKIDTTPIQLLTEQYQADLWEYKKRESLYLETENKLKEILSNFRLFELKTVAYLVLLIYWSIILLGTFVL